VKYAGRTIGIFVIVACIPAASSRPARAQSSGVAAAGAPARVHVVLPSCDKYALDRDALLAMLRIELHQDGVDVIDEGPGPPRLGDPPLATITIRAPCEPAADEWTISVDDAATAKSIQRTVSFADLDVNARPRAVALAVAELLRASWAELALPDVPPSDVPLPTIRRVVRLREHLDRSEETREPARVIEASESTPALVTALDARSWTSYSTSLLGPRIEVQWPAPRGVPLRLTVDAGAAFGSNHDPVGDVDLVLVSGAAALTLTGGAYGIQGEMGPSVELGWARAKGVPLAPLVQGSQVETAVVVTSLRAAAGYAIAAHWRAVAGLEVGGTPAALDVRAEGRRVAGIGGAEMGARIGLGYNF
jgi:hypothetical protein